MKKSTILLFAITLLIGCVDNNPYTEELTEKLSKIPFNEKVIENIHQFDSLEIILVENKNLLFAENNRLVFRSLKNGSIGFFPGINETELNRPILEKIKPIFIDLAKKGVLKSIHMMERKSPIMFHIENNFIYEYSTNHNENLFNQKRSTEGIIAKDTLLLNKFYYHINLDRDYQ